MQVSIRCPSCLATLSVDHSWTWVRCGCGCQFSMPLAVTAPFAPPGYERAQTGAFVRTPSYWAGLTGRKCARCGRRGFIEDGGRLATGQYVSHRREWGEERQYGAFGAGPEIGRSQHEVFVPTTVREYVHIYGCAWCGFCWNEAETQTL